MTQKTYNVTNFRLTFSGFAFSGYLSSVKFFTSGCAYSEPCPLFLRHPACYYGFGLFSTLFLTAALAATGKISNRASRYALRRVSFLGALFAGQFVFQEILRFIASGFQPGELILPTCAYGFLFFLTILALSFHEPTTDKIKVHGFPPGLTRSRLEGRGAVAGRSSFRRAAPPLQGLPIPDHNSDDPIIWSAVLMRETE